VFAGTTPLPPPLAGAALAALRILRREPGRRKRLRENAARVRLGLRAGGWDIAETPGPIVRLPAMNEAGVRELRARLLADGIYPPFLKYGSASGEGFFRFVISSEHTREQLTRVVEVLGGFKSRSSTPRRRAAPLRAGRRG
jgi:glycine C-acetyltransferase/8-amino-7-oxononanoate synthase